MELDKIKNREIPLLIVCSSELSIEAMGQRSFLWNSLFIDTEAHSTGLSTGSYMLRDRLERFDAIIFAEENLPRARTYNSALEFIKENPYYRNVLFINDDISVEDSFFFHKIKRSLMGNQIVGLAGATKITLDSSDEFSTSWLGFSKPEDRSGSISHFASPEHILTSSHGPMPKKCEAIDGSFILCDVNSILDNDIKFDEEISCDTHFYDLDFCLEAKKKGLEISTWPFWGVQKPTGVVADEDSKEYEKGREYFFEKWKER